MKKTITTFAFIVALLVTSISSFALSGRDPDEPPLPQVVGVDGEAEEDMHKPLRAV